MKKSLTYTQEMYIHNNRYTLQKMIANDGRKKIHFKNGSMLNKEKETKKRQH